ncbi:MAG: hypothetical protein HZC51_05770 [Nitrospirae bacterium]|nr:hypothetical protein [Nitrospirota bacterium]
MGTLKQQAILLSLVKAMKKNGSWCGETHVQKSAFFLKRMLGVPIDFEFVLYKHGPYSFDLRDELDEMRANLTLGLQSNPYPYGPSYIPGNSAKILEERFPKASNEYRNQIEFVAENISAKSVADLERIATAFFVSQDPLYPDAPQRIKHIVELKPHISEIEAEDALKTVGGLLQRSKELAITE